MNAKELRTAYHTFFEERGHRRIPSAPLLPENDASVLFTTAGMQPLVPYLLGEPHPLGRRLVNVQKCIRTNDIEEVGDTSHLTFFEMLGNWSLGDYFKSESLAWSMEFLTEVLKIERERLAVTVFAGDEDAPRDEQSFQIWRKLGMPEDRIFYLSREENWWGPVGQTGPCGPDSEIFYDTGRPDHPGCRPGCPCGKWFEIWNNVFMEYNRTLDGRFERLPSPNVDTGMGVDRTVAALNGYDDTFRIDTIWPIVRRLEELSGRSYTDDPRPFRVIADHVRAAVMAIVDGARPSNVEAGYIVRRLIRRSMVYARQLGVTEPVCGALSEVALEVFSGIYPGLEQTREETRREIEQEESRFLNTLERGLKHYHRTAERALEEGRKAISGQEAFDLFQTYGFPLPLTVELAGQQGLEVDQAGFGEQASTHRQISRRGMAQKFRGGLADQSEEATHLHTATHLLHEALRQVLGPEVRQMGSNITPERLRFDFSYDRPLSPEQVEQVERLVNQQIEQSLPVRFEVLTMDEALRAGALAFFGDKYGDQVKVYSIGDFSKEVCGGPHASHTGMLGCFRIVKQESAGKGLRRIRAVLEKDLER